MLTGQISYPDYARSRDPADANILAFASPGPTRRQADPVPPAAVDVRRATARRNAPTDDLLLRQVANGDKAAMHIIFVRHRAKVLRFIQRIVHDSAIADDIVSQVFLDVWRSAQRFEHRARVSTWLLAIARFKALNALRRRSFASIDDDEAMDVRDPGATPEEHYERSQWHRALHARIRQLSPPHRRIIDLYYYRELSIDEVSRAIGVPPATAKSRLFYARKQLASLLLNDGIRMNTAGG